MRNIEEGRMKQRIAELEGQRLCNCTCADQCPFGKSGMQARCNIKDAMAALLDRVAHTKTEYPYGHPLFARQRCLPDCPACAWSKLREGK